MAAGGGVARRCRPSWSRRATTAPVCTGAPPQNPAGVRLVTPRPGRRRPADGLGRGPLGRRFPWECRHRRVMVAAPAGGVPPCGGGTGGVATRRGPPMVAPPPGWTGGAGTAGAATAASPRRVGPGGAPAVDGERARGGQPGQVVHPGPVMGQSASPVGLPRRSACLAGQPASVPPTASSSSRRPKRRIASSTRLALTSPARTRDSRAATTTDSASTLKCRRSARRVSERP